MKLLLQKILTALARAHIKKYEPMIIGVTGNAGKTSTKEAIAAVVGHVRTVRSAAGNLNNEFGFPLTVLGDWDREYYDRGSSPGLWFRVLWAGVIGLVYRNCPEVFLLEYGADHPGDIRRLARTFRPHIAVVTTVGPVPVHIEFFKDAEALADEKANLVKVLAPSGHAVLNHDDDRVLDMKEKTKAHIATYGFDDNSTVKVSDFEYKGTEEGKPVGVTFKLHQGSTFVPVTVNGSLGRSQAYAAAAAAAVGSILGMNLVQVSQALSGYHGPKGRLKILVGIKRSTIIDDTYNASPASTRLALETLHDLPGLRKIAVLGDMLELGEHTIRAHQDAGTFAATFVDVLVCVGARAKFIAEAASDQMSRDNIFTFDTSDDAKEEVRQLIREHDLVLVKGSQGIRMEKIVEEIMAEPENKKELLVRQSRRWLSK